MAAPMKTCGFCKKNIRDKSYRSLASNISQDHYGNIFKILGIAMTGVLCNQCVNKLNRIRKLNGDIETKVVSLTEERDKLLATLKAMPGIIQQCVSTPRRGEKRPLVKQTPTPRSRLKKSLFCTPTRKCSPAPKVTPEKRVVTQVTRSTQTKQPREDFDVKITVKYPHGERSKYVNTEPEKSALKAMMNSKKPEAIMKHYRKNDKYKDAIMNVVKKEIQKEINVLVRRNGNVFQNQSSENLLKFDWTAVSHEFQAKAPYLHNILCGAANLDLRTKKKLPGVITSAAILLYTRSQGLNQLQYILGLIADKCGMTKEGLKILHDLGVVVSPTSIMKKKKQLVKQQEKQIMETVSTYVNHKQEFTRNASGPSPTAGLESDTEVTSFAACGDSETQGLPCHAAVVESEADKTQYHTGRTESSAENNLLFSAACEIDDKSDTGDHSVQNIISKPKPIEILGDNLDVTISPAKMTMEKQRKSLHWFLVMAKQKRITAEDLNLPSDMLRERNDVLRVPTNSWIPSMVQTDSLCKNIVFHVSHILLKYIEFLKPASASFPTYISHPYMEKTKEKSIFLNCDLIEASENSSQGMITILQRIHHLAVPHVDNETPERIVFGGDVLTNERAFSAQEAMQNVPSEFESLSGLIHRPEGLHREMNFLLVY
nr:uncharacterized protein LOC117688213 [Crassostrea gigas]XP_034321928.1 uncharacterized protein LOC117688213 [Crassostrea gigas]